MEANVQVVLAGGEADIAEEAQFAYLNTLGFVRTITAQEQWYVLVNDAYHAAKLPINEPGRDYLGFMLHRYMKRIDFYEKLTAFDYAQYLLGAFEVDAACRQEVADLSLQYVVFFPERSVHRHEPRSLAYSADLGVSLYHDLAREAEGKDDWFSRAYQEMAKSFGQATMVLRSVCPRFVHRRAVEKEAREAHFFPHVRDRINAAQLVLMHYKPHRSGHV